MAVEAQRIKARLKAKYPKANLSNNRLDEISAKLSSKAEDDADDAALDALLDTANSFNDFEELARNDDKIRALEAKVRAPGTPTPPAAGDPSPPTPDQPEAMPAWFKAYAEKVSALEEAQKGLTLAQKAEAFKAKAAAKKIPAFVIETVKVTEDFDEVTALAESEAKWIQIQQEHFNGTEPYRPGHAGGNGSKKEASKEEIENVLKDIM